MRRMLIGLVGLLAAGAGCTERRDLRVGDEYEGERQPVSGRAFVVDEAGREWLITDPLAVDRIERLLDDAGDDSLSEFQAKNGIAVTGKIDEQTAYALGLDWRELLRSRSPE